MLSGFGFVMDILEILLVEILVEIYLVEYIYVVYSFFKYSVIIVNCFDIGCIYFFLFNVIRRKCKVEVIWEYEYVLVFVILGD